MNRKEIKEIFVVAAPAILIAALGSFSASSEIGIDRLEPVTISEAVMPEPSIIPGRGFNTRIKQP